MKKILMVILMIILFFSISSMAEQSPDIILRTKYLYLDKNFNGHRVLINITVNNIDNTKHLAYVEEYYRIDSDGNPALINSGRYYDNIMVTNFISFEIIRPKKGSAGTGYSLIKGVILLDNQRIFETWINSSGTYKSAVSQSNLSSTIKVKPDIEKRTAPFGETVDSYVENRTAPFETTVKPKPIASKGKQKTVDGRYPLITIIAIFIMYMFARNKRRNE